MSRQPLGNAVLTGAALALAACGGAGGEGTNFIPSPPTTTPPAPPPPPAANPAFMRVTPASQEFTAKGATFSEVAFPAYDGPLTASGDQLRIRYDASAKKYEIMVPQTSDWRAIMREVSRSK